jgi:DNA-binding CsgD family transcriptional regulator
MRRGRPRHDDILTPREWQVLRLVREGLTNEQIAERLGISLSTAKYHVAETMAKLDVADRRDAVERITERKRGAWVLAIWPLRTFAAKTLVAAGAGATIIAVLALVAFLGQWGHGGGDRRTAINEARSGPDLAPDGLDEYERLRRASPYQHTVLLAASLPSNFSAEDMAVVEALPRVRSLRHLEAVLTDDVRLIVIDSGSANEVEDGDFLHRQLEAGRAVVELNVCFDQVHYRGTYPPKPFSGEITEIGADGAVHKIVVDSSQRPPSTCTLPLASGVVPFFGFRRLATPLEANEFQRLGRGISNESVVNLNLAIGALKVVITRLDGGFDGNALPFTCDEGRLAGLEHLLCPE